MPTLQSPRIGYLQPSSHRVFPTPLALKELSSADQQILSLLLSTILLQALLFSQITLYFKQLLHDTQLNFLHRSGDYDDAPRLRLR
jgi:hypothetical protein